MYVSTLAVHVHDVVINLSYALAGFLVSTLFVANPGYFSHWVYKQAVNSPLIINTSIHVHDLPQILHVSPVLRFDIVA